MVKALSDGLKKEAYQLIKEKKNEFEKFSDKERHDRIKQAKRVEKMTGPVVPMALRLIALPVEVPQLLQGS